MSNNTRWPDVNIASTLRSFFASPSDAQEKADLEGAEAIAQLRANGIQHLSQQGQASKAQADERVAQGQDLDEPDLSAIMADNDTSYDQYDQTNEDGPSADADFGPLEMFDSNAPQAQFSSQVAGEAPEALMEGIDGSANSKKSKKKKKKGHSHNDASADSEQKTSGHVAQGSSEAGAEEEIEEAHNGDENAEPTNNSKKKRKHHSDSTSGKGRKKRRGQDGEVDATPDSPSEARLVRQTRSREGSAAPEDDMNVDQDGKGEENEHQEQAIPTRDVEALAREAWTEHMNSDLNGRGNAVSEVPAEDGELAADTTVYEELEEPPKEPPSSASKKSRSAKGKKAKPTFFEQPPDLNEDDGDELDALGNLPSPSAVTPKARKRGKQSSRTAKKSRDKLSHSMRGGSAEDDEGEDGEHNPRNRRTKMMGYTQGRFTDAELAQIAGAIERFRVENDMEQPAVNEMIQAPGGTTAGDAHAELWTRIFAECPDRHRQKIINVARKRWHNFVARGTWTPEQDAELTALIEQHGQKWSKIGAIINRHPEDLRDRYRNYLVCGTNQRKDTWNEGEEGRLTQYVIEAMEAIDELRRIQPSRELLKKPYEELIDWQNISERMDRTRSRLQCITKWKSLNIRTHGKDQLASSQPDAQISFRLEKARRQIAQMPDEERCRLVMAIRGTSATSEAKVPWQRLVDKEFRNSWHRTTQVLLWRRLRFTVPDQDTKSVQECAEHLLEVRNQTNELPDVNDSLFDLQDEMTFMSSLPASGAPGGGAGAAGGAGGASGKRRRKSDKNAQQGAGGPISEEFVRDADEDDEENANHDTDAATATAAAALTAVAALPHADDIEEGGPAPEAVMSDLQIDPALAEATVESIMEVEPDLTDPGLGSVAATLTKKRTTKKPRKKSKKNTAPELDQEVIPGEEDDINVLSPSELIGGGEAKVGDLAEEHRDSDSNMEDMEDLPAQTEHNQAF